MAIDWLQAVGVVGVAILAALAGVICLHLLSTGKIAPRSGLFSHTNAGSVFLFDGEVLIDSTPGARALLTNTAIRGGPWVRLQSFLSGRFADVEVALQRLPEVGCLTMTSRPERGRPLLLQAEHSGGLTRIVLSDPASGDHTVGMDPLAQQAMTDELATLRDTLAQAPVLIWRETAAGEVVWANAGYLILASQLPRQGQEWGWPLHRVFEKTAVAQGVAGQRQCVQQAGQPSRWFDLICQQDGELQLIFALPADAAVHAETALRDFMQTLTKTFAQLPIGLAIFDKQRKLQLFNPALLDLTGLPADFLSLRPSFLSVLDALRDRNMLPEPKDYRGWRRQIVDMEKAAASGLYEETWNLADGQTYRVVGRPHPNGALALMIEDISTEMLRTRRYRADLELGQAVIDELDEAVAVFAQSGQLVMSNAAYSALWGHDPAAGLAECTAGSLATHWRSLSSASRLWNDVEDYVATIGDRESWKAEARLLDGRLVQCRFSPLSAGATLATFRAVTTVEVGQSKLAETKRRKA